MRHADARELLADLALEPGRLARLGDDASPETAGLRRHLAGCVACTDELEAWRRTWAQVGAALGDGAAAAAWAEAADDTIATAGAGGDETSSETGGADTTPPADRRESGRAPAALRAKTLARVAAEGEARPKVPSRPAARDTRPRAGDTSRPRHWAPWLAVAAALVIALGAGSLAWTRTRDLDRAHLENAGLTETMASLDRVLATPAHWTVTLRTPDGTDGGTMAWSGSEIAVITTALPAPADGQSYRCWVERDGVRTPVGPMWFSGTTGYWAGPIGSWSALLTPGSHVGVSLLPAGDGPATPVLVGSL